MSDISTGQNFTTGMTVTAPIMNNIIGLAAINSSFISTKNPITNLQNNDNFVLARNDGSWARITGAALADGLVNAEPNFARIAVGPLQTQTPVVNGDMQIWQRLTSLASVGAAGSVYVTDKWKSISNGAPTALYTASQQAAGITGTANYPDTAYCLRATVTTTQVSLAAGDSEVIGQFVERQMARVLFDNPSSLSILLRCSITGTFCVSLRNNNGGATNQSYVVECPITSANVWQRFTFPAIATMPTGTGTWGTSDTDYSYVLSVSLGSGTTWRTTPGAWQTGNFVATSNQTNLFATNGATLDITLVQHEAGNVVTPFSWTPFDVSLIKCQRYFYKSWDYLTAVGSTTATGGWAGYNATTSTSYIFQKFPVQQRVDSPMTVSSLYSTNSGANGKVFNVGTAADVTPSGIGNPAQWGLTSIQSAAAFTANNVIQFNFTSDADF